MNKVLLDKLLATGKFTQSEAEGIAKAIPADGATADVDRLTKALAAVRETIAKGGAAAIYSQEDMDKLAAETGSVVDAVAGATDKVVKAFAEQADKLTNLIITMTEKVQELETRLDSQTERVSKAMGIPYERKSVPNPDPKANGTQPSPHEEVPTALSKSMVTAGALTELSDKGTDQMRKGELGRAISLLNAGRAPQAVVDEFRIKIA